MKKLILFLFLAIGFIANAQTVTFPQMVSNATIQTVSTAYVLTNTTARNFIFTAPQPKPCTQDFIIKLDSLSGNHTNVAVAIYGQKSAIKGDYTQIGSTVNWKGTSKDTVIIISNASANRYSNYKYTITGTGTGTTNITPQVLKLYLE